MKHLDVFRSLTASDSRLGFYTKGTRDRIPEIPGCYAWFVPLWIYREDFDELTRIVDYLIDYEQEPVKEVQVPFTWESVTLRVRRSTKSTSRERSRATWAQVLGNPAARDALQQTLMEASLFMPPLYVGRTNNLKQRYLQHTKASEPQKNVFFSRFQECVERLRLKISVGDLIFACIETPSAMRDLLGDSDESDSNQLIEHLLMQFCRPPFSIK
jgi:hypothetical protein